MNHERPAPSEFRPEFGRYVSLVPDGDLVEFLTLQGVELADRCAGLPDAKASFRYAPGKWSVRELLGHVLDTERVFGYRTLALARGDSSDLPSFEENGYAAASGHDRVPIGELAEEFSHLRKSHVLLLRHLEEAAWGRVGSVSGFATSTRAMAFVLAGHAAHHAAVLARLYGVGAAPAA